MTKVKKDYLEKDISLYPWQKVGIACLVIVISGMLGWLYEFIFYYFNGGMKQFYMQGGNFLPWINIYAIGALLIIAITYQYRKEPWKVFLLSTITTGLLEFLSGYTIFHLVGRRLWDYNVEILNFGNIGGYVCFRSVLCFGLSGLVLMYVLLPFAIYLAQKTPKKVFLSVTTILCGIILIDEFYNLIFARVLALPRASAIYKKLGFHYVKFH